MKDLSKAILSATPFYYVIRYEMINSRQEKGIATFGTFSTPEEAKAFKDKLKELGYLDSREYSTCQIVKIEN
ncbi:MAG: hypothetical protein II453_11820 [Alphaproteobacteria bacterium]|nr:hypothetical protein [Alphaproteobacteria bacterium]MBQ3945467.1 hypothetical protein [Alphaproteobacteria bacterium]